jgi:hypothetical protein
MGRARDTYETIRRGRGMQRRVQLEEDKSLVRECIQPCWRESVCPRRHNDLCILALVSIIPLI